MKNPFVLIFLNFLQMWRIKSLIVTPHRHIFSHVRSMSMSTSSNTIAQMSPIQLSSILKSDSRDLYQIIDVREPDELNVAKISDENVMNLSLSTAQDWTTKVLAGDILDSSKPTICLCHHGGRSMQIASFLGKYVCDISLLHNRIVI